MVMFYVQSLFWLLLALLLGYLLGRWIKGLMCRRREPMQIPESRSGEMPVARAASSAAERAGLYTGGAADTVRTPVTARRADADAAVAAPVVRAERREIPAADLPELIISATAGRDGDARLSGTARTDDRNGTGVLPLRAGEQNATDVTPEPDGGTGVVAGAAAGLAGMAAATLAGRAGTATVDAEAGTAVGSAATEGGMDAPPLAVRGTGVVTDAGSSDCARHLLALLQDAAATAARTGTLTRALWLEAGRCDCGCLPGQKLVLEAGASGTLGGLACSVSRSGSVGVGGDFSNLEPGRLVLFQRHGMVACRQGEAYCFVLPDDVNTGFRAPPMPDTDRADSGISGAHEAGAVAAAVGVASAALGGISAMQSGRDRVIPASGSISSGPAPEVRVIPASGSISSGPDENAEAGTVPLRVIPASGSITGGPTLSLSGLAQQALDEARVSGNQTRALLLAQVDCEQAGGEPELVLTAKHYDRIGSIHCGVPGAGFVVVGGDVASLEDGRAVLFTRHRIVVCRSGDEHRFLRLEPEQA